MKCIHLRIFKNNKNSVCTTYTKKYKYIKLFLQLDWLLEMDTQKIIYQRSEKATADPRLRAKRSRRDESIGDVA